MSLDAKIAWQVDEYDPDAIHDTASNTNRFTIPTGGIGVWYSGLSGDGRYEMAVAEVLVSEAERPAAEPTFDGIEKKALDEERVQYATSYEALRSECEELRQNHQVLQQKCLHLEAEIDSWRHNFNESQRMLAEALHARFALLRPLEETLRSAATDRALLELAVGFRGLLVAARRALALPLLALVVWGAWQVGSQPSLVSWWDHMPYDAWLSVTGTLGVGVLVSLLFGRPEKYQ